MYVYFLIVVWRTLRWSRRGVPKEKGAGYKVQAWNQAVSSLNVTLFFVNLPTCLGRTSWDKEVMNHVTVVVLNQWIHELQHQHTNPATHATKPWSPVNLLSLSV